MVCLFAFGAFEQKPSHLTSSLSSGPPGPPLCPPVPRAGLTQAAAPAGCAEAFHRMLQGAVWSCRREQPRLQERFGHLYMKLFTLEIKLYLGLLVFPPPPPLWEVLESYCGDQHSQGAVSIHSLRRALQAPSAPSLGDPVHMKTWPPLEVTGFAPAQHVPTPMQAFPHLDPLLDLLLRMNFKLKLND